MIRVGLLDQRPHRVGRIRVREEPDSRGTGIRENRTARNGIEGKSSSRFRPRGPGEIGLRARPQVPPRLYPCGKNDERGAWGGGL